MAPVEARVERRLFSHDAAQHAPDESGGDVDEVRPRTACPQCLDQPRRAAQVGLRGQIGRVVEFHGRRRMDDDVACSQLLAAFIVETKPVATKIDLDHAKLCGRELGETLLTELFLQTFESGARQHLALEALERGAASAGTNR